MTRNWLAQRPAPLRARLAVKSPSVRSRDSSTFATAPATAQPAPTSHGRDTTTTIQPAVADGSSSARRGAWLATSSSTTQTTQDSSANRRDFFNSLLELAHVGLLRLRT